MSLKTDEITDNFLKAFDTEYARLLINEDKRNNVGIWLLKVFTEANLYRITYPADVSMYVEEIFVSRDIRSFVLNVTANFCFFYSDTPTDIDKVFSAIITMVNCAGIKNDIDDINTVVPLGIKGELLVTEELKAFLTSNCWYVVLILIAMNLDKTYFYNSLKAEK